MSTIRKLFGLNRLYYKYTAMHLFSIALVVVLVGFIFALAGYESPSFIVVAVPLGIILFYFNLRAWLRLWVVNRYVKSYQQFQVKVPVIDIANTSINYELDQVDRIRPIAQDGDAVVNLTTFDFYQQTKNGEYLSKQVFYLVLKLPLIRILPHVLFDSKDAKKRQFKYLYIQAQKIDMQPPFAAVFDTYGPLGYTIDTLSFITPELMQALLDCQQYDIEIVDNNLLLYAPLLLTAEIPGFIERGKTLAAQVNDNIENYRDDRLSGDARRTSVTTFARSLMISPLHHIIFSVLLGLTLTTIVIGAVYVDPGNWSNDVFNKVTFLLFVVFCHNSYKAIQIIIENQQKMRQYHELQQSLLSGKDY
jgi:hypothetical protein